MVGLQQHEFKWRQKLLITDIIFNMHMNFKIIHSIPGRMRIHVPIAKKIPTEWEFNNSHLDIVKIIRGISKLEFNYVTSNALITYNPNITGDKKIIADLKQIASIANKYKKELMAFESDEKDQASKYFAQIVTENYNQD